MTTRASKQRRIEIAERKISVLRSKSSVRAEVVS